MFIFDIAIFSLLFLLTAFFGARCTKRSDKISSYIDLAAAIWPFW